MFDTDCLFQDLVYAAASSTGIADTNMIPLLQPVLIHFCDEILNRVGCYCSSYICRSQTAGGHSKVDTRWYLVTNAGMVRYTGTTVLIGPV